MKTRNFGSCAVLALGAALLITLSGTAAEVSKAAGDAEKERVLRVAMECKRAPYNWSQEDGANGAVPIAHSSRFANGFDVMVAKRICEELDYKLEIYDFDWDSLVPAVVSDSVDCAIAGQTVTEDALSYVTFTEPYYKTAITAVTRQDSEYASASGISDLAGAVCTSQEGTVWYDICLLQIPEAEIKAARETTGSAFKALDKEKCDVVVADYPIAAAACNKYPDLKLLDFSSYGRNFDPAQEELVISVGSGRTELVEELNTVLASMDSSELDDMMETAIGLWPLPEPETEE